MTLLSGTSTAGEPASGTPVPRPGARSRQAAQRRRDEAAQLLSEADHLERTAAGQERTAATLAWLPPGFSVAHDLAVPGARAAVDHLVIGPTGVFAISTEVHEGTVRYGTGTLWRNRNPMRRDLQAIAHEAGRLSAVLDVAVTPVVCFAHGDLPRRELTLEGARVLSMAGLLPYLTERDVTLRADDVERLVQEAERLTRASRRVAAPPAPMAEMRDVESPVVTPPTPAPAAHRASSNRGSNALRTAAGLATVGLLAYGIGAVIRDRSHRRSPAVAVAGTTVTRVAGTSVGSTTDTLPPLAALASCPSPGQGWTLTPVWPGLASGAARYELSWRPSGAPTWIVAGPWASLDEPPPTMLERLAAGTTVEVRVIAQNAQHRTLAQSITALHTPDTAC